MENNNSSKKIWVKVKRKDQGEEIISELLCFDIYESQTGHQIKETVLEACDLTNVKNIVLKLRNHRGSVIPFTWNLAANPSARPYLLEVVKIHQKIKAQPRSVKIKSMNDTIKDKVSNITSRLEKLEAASPALKEKRNDRIDKEMKEVEQMLRFLAKRMQDAENVKWKGMFKKNPLW